MNTFTCPANFWSLWMNVTIETRSMNGTLRLKSGSCRMISGLNGFWLHCTQSAWTSTMSFKRQRRTVVSISQWPRLLWTSVADCTCWVRTCWRGWRIRFTKLGYRCGCLASEPRPNADNRTPASKTSWPFWRITASLMRPIMLNVSRSGWIKSKHTDHKTNQITKTWSDWYTKTRIQMNKHFKWTPNWNWFQKFSVFTCLAKIQETRGNVPANLTL